MTEPAGGVLETGRRDPSMDSLRFIAVTLVMLFHFLNPLASPAGPLEGLFLATWALRVPLLAFVAGWFSSAELPTRRSVTRLLQSVVAVYVLFDLLLRVQFFWLTGRFLTTWDRPMFGLWFLVSLASWRVLLPYLVRIRWFGAVSVAAALLIGFTSVGASFSLSHTIAQLPLFLLGWYARQVGLRERLTGPLVRGVAAAILVSSVILGWELRGVIAHRVWAMDAGYGDDPATGVLWRALLLCWAVAVQLSMLALVPRTRIPLITACGAGSMSAYLLHQLIYRQWRYNGGPTQVSAGGWPALLGLILAVLALAVVLMLPAVRRWVRPVVQPTARWFLRDESRDRSSAPVAGVDGLPELGPEPDVPRLR